MTCEWHKLWAGDIVTRNFASLDRMVIPPSAKCRGCIVSVYERRANWVGSECLARLQSSQAKFAVMEKLGLAASTAWQRRYRALAC
jgi:hypothetical protein